MILTRSGHEMTGCIESGLSLLQREIDATIERLVPQVEALLARLAPDETVTSEPDEHGHRVSVPLRFPDAIGTSHVLGRLFRYRDHVRVDVEVVHNRMLARPNGRPSDRRCYLNDFVASVTVAAKTDELSLDFRRGVVGGVRAARDAVQRHNRAQPAPWNQVRVVAQP